MNIIAVACALAMLSIYGGARTFIQLPQDPARPDWRPINARGMSSQEMGTAGTRKKKSRRQRKSETRKE